MRRCFLAFGSSALLATVGVSLGCNGSGGANGDGDSDDSDDFGDVDAGESGVDSAFSGKSSATETITAGDDDWGDDGDDDGWGDDASEDDGGNGVCAFNGVYGYVEVAPDSAVPGAVQSYYCEVGEVVFESGGDWSQLRAFMSCREQEGPEFETGLSIEASPGFQRFIDEGDRLRITRAFVASGPEQGLRIAFEREGEGRILSFLEGASLNSSIGPDPALPFFRGVESMGCTATEGVTCGEGPAQRLVFETPAGQTRVGHQEAKLGQPPGDLNVWVSEAFTTTSPGCDSAVEYTVLMIRA